MTITRGTTTTTRPRLRWLDGLRGLGVLLMVGDHLLAIIAPGSIVRYTITRVSLPCLMLSAGVMAQLKPTRWARLADVFAVGVVGTCVFAMIGLGVPDPVFVFGVALLSLKLLSLCLPMAGAAIVAVALGVTQSYAWRLGVSGYQPGTMLALVGGAAGLGTSSIAWLSRVAGFIPAPVRWFGRRPLLVYLLHLPILLGLAEVVG